MRVHVFTAICDGQLITVAAYETKGQAVEAMTAAITEVDAIDGDGADIYDANGSRWVFGIAEVHLETTSRTQGAGWLRRKPQEGGKAWQ